jgi:hypothetical protein
LYYESLPNPSDLSNPDEKLTKKDLERRRYEYMNSNYKMMDKPKPKKTLKTSEAVKFLSNLLISERSRQDGSENPDSKVLFIYYSYYQNLKK